MWPVGFGDVPNVVGLCKGECAPGEVLVLDDIDEPSILVCLDTLPFSHFSISAPTLTYHDARNRRDASRELRKPTQSRAHSMLDFR